MAEILALFLERIDTPIGELLLAADGAGRQPDLSRSCPEKLLCR
jgi:hypothetical protein